MTAATDVFIHGAGGTPVRAGKGTALSGGAVAAPYWDVQDIQGGGWVTGYTVHEATQTVFARTDVGGAYRRDGNRWTELLHADGWTGAPDPVDYTVGGIGVAPTDVNRIYLSVGTTAKSNGQILTSHDGGITWTRTAIGHPIGGNDGDNSGYKLPNRRIAVDPRDANHALVGTLTGVYRTIDGGTTWTELTMPSSGTAGYGVALIHFDAAATSPTDAGGRSSRWWIAINLTTGTDNGFFRTDDSGATWVKVSWDRASDGRTAFSPATLFDIKDMSNGDWFVTAWGDVFRVPNPGTATSVAVTTLVSTSTASSAYVTGSAWDDVRGAAFDPSDENRMIAMDSGFASGGYGFVSYDGGATWNRIDPSIANGTDGAVWPTMTDLAGHMSNGGLAWLNDGTIWFFEGMGTWTLNGHDALLSTSHDTTPTWQHTSGGIEEIVAEDIVKIPAANGGKLIMGGWDRNVWTWDTLDSAAKPVMSSFNSCWSLDYCRANPSHVVALIDNHQYAYWADLDYPDTARQTRISTDGGATWALIGSLATTPGTHPDVLKFGNIVFSSTDPTKLVWIPTKSETAGIWYSHDSGATWTQATGLASTNHFHNAHYLRRQAVVADPHNGNTFYAMRQSSGTDALVRSTDGGMTWAAYGDSSGLPTYNKEWNGTLLAVDNGNLGTTLFWSSGWANQWEHNLHKSSDGGLTWTSVAGTPGTHKVGAGAPVNGIPVIWCNHRDPAVAALVNERVISRSFDLGNTWEAVGTFPLGRYDTITAITGDPDDPEGAYFCHIGTGVITRRSA